MSDEFIEKALQNAAIAYLKLKLTRSDIEWQLSCIDRDLTKAALKVVSLAALCDDAPKDRVIKETLSDVSKMGLTEAVRSIVRASDDWLTAMQIRDQVVRLGVNLSKYKNPLASVYTILGRLEDEVDISMRQSGSSRGKKGKSAKETFVFRWKGQAETVWDRLQALPPEKADEIVKKTAHEIAGDQIRQASRRRSKK